MRLLALLLMCAAVPSQASRIADTIYLPSGQRASGLLTITPTCTRGTSGAMFAGPMVIRFVFGRLNFELQPTDTASPAGCYYTVHYELSDKTVLDERWAVPTTTAALRISQVKLNDTPPPPSIGPLGGDLAGEISTAVVWRIRGHVVTGNNPADGQMMRYNTTAEEWELVTLVDQETPAGGIDGSNAVFTLSSAPTPARSLILFRNGMVMKRGLDYTLEGGTITFISEATPQPGDVLLAWYRF